MITKKEYKRKIKKLESKLEEQKLLTARYKQIAKDFEYVIDNQAKPIFIKFSKKTSSIIFDLGEDELRTI